MSLAKIYRNVRQTSPLGDYRGNTFVGHFISSQFSPFLTHIFIKFKVIPNKITLLMILAGLVGALLFVVDNIYFKILSLIFINLWFIFDCCDGEVARLTKKFSLMGKELDYVAHSINHPFLFAAYFYVAYSISLSWVASIPLLIIGFFDVMQRSIMGLDLVYNLKSSQAVGNSNVKSRKSFLNYAVSNFVITPNFVVFYPLLFVIDYFLNTGFSLFYSVFTCVFYVVLIPRSIFKTTMKFVVS